MMPDFGGFLTVYRVIFQFWASIGMEMGKKGHHRGEAWQMVAKLEK